MSLCERIALRRVGSGRRMARRILLVILMALPFAGRAEEVRGAITAICGGGITGQMTGRQALPDGRILAVSGMAGAVSPSPGEPLGHDPAAVQRWTEALRDGGFQRLRVRQPANYACSLAWNGVVLTWPGETPPPGIPAPVQQVFLALRAFGQAPR